MTREEQARRLMEVLRDDATGLADAGARALVEDALALPLETFVDAEALRTVALRLMTSDNVARVASRHVRPGIERFRAGFAASGERPADWMDAALRGRLEGIVATAKPPRMRWAARAVDPALLRRLFAPVLQDTLIGFARKLPLPGVGSGGAGSGGGSSTLSSAASGLLGIGRSLKAQVEKRAEPLLETGRSLLGSVSAEFEAKVQGAAREFSEGAMAGIKDAIRDRLRSDEGREIEREIRGQVLATILDTPVHELMADIDTLPLDAIDAWVADVVAFAAQGERLDAILAREIDAFLEREGKRTVGELLDEAGVRELVVERTVAHLTRVVRDVPASDRMVSFVADWLTKADLT